MISFSLSFCSLVSEIQGFIITDSFTNHQLRAEITAAAEQKAALTAAAEHIFSMCTTYNRPQPTCCWEWAVTVVEKRWVGTGRELWELEFSRFVISDTAEERLSTPSETVVGKFGELRMLERLLPLWPFASAVRQTTVCLPHCKYTDTFSLSILYFFSLSQLQMLAHLLLWNYVWIRWLCHSN